jgi:transcriptional regulator with XRE-family HTH domain
MPRPESKTLGHLYDRFIAGDPERVASYEKALADSEVAGAIYTLRTEAGLSQRELAARVGTTASVICRLEDADYDGHSLSMLRRIAAALNRRVIISFAPAVAASSAEVPPPAPRPRTAASAKFSDTQQELLQRIAQPRGKAPSGPKAGKQKSGGAKPKASVKPRKGRSPAGSEGS